MNNQYQCFGRDLTTDCARKLIQELFKGQTIRRREIVNAVFEQHHERGGMNSGVRPNIIQSSLKSMKESGLAANPEHGVWYITYYIKTLNEFTKWASQFDSREDSKQYLFRGVSSADYKIDASAYRRIKKGRDSEEEQDGDFEIFLQLNKNLISEARFRGHDRKNGRKLEDLEVLAEFQHYGAATFLMDFTYNALVSLWFACKKSSRNGAKDGKVVAIPPHDPRFTGVTTDFSVITLETLEKQIDQLSLDNKRLYQWQPRQQQNERIIAQQSIFLFGVLEIEINPDEECIIDGNSKEKIRESLKRIYGIAEDMLFPDFDGFARQYNQDEPYKELSATQYRQRANEAIQRGEYIKAIDDYSMAIHLNANYVEARYERGLANNNLGFTNNRQKQYEAARPYFDAAITDFDAVLNITPNDARSHYQRGLANNAIEEYNTAIADFDAVLNITPNDARSHYQRGLANNAIKEYNTAITDFSESIRLNANDAYSYYHRGLAKFHLGQHEAAIDDYDEAHQNPYYALRQYLERYESAIDDYDQTIRLSPDHAEAYYQRGLTRHHLEEYQLAISDFDMFISRNANDANAHYYRAEANFSLERLPAAEADLQTALQLAEQPDDADLIDRIEYLLYEINSRTVREPEDE